MRSAVPLLALLALACGSDRFRYPHDDVLTIWHGQVKATHNSYHIQPDINIQPWAYTHLPLDQQASQQAVRAFELDLNYDATTGALEVYHIVSLDDRTTCRRFHDCLATLKAWSDANPGHFPLFLQMEGKSGFPSAAPEQFFQSVEREILAVWPRERLVTPADVQRGGATLGWPTLAASRGRILFAWDDTGELRTAYTHGGQDLTGRLIFVDSAPTDPFAAVAILNDPVADATRIGDAVRAGMLVRTRADADGVEPAAGDTTRRDAALASGAHFISTDFPAPVTGVNYVVEIPGGMLVRCNPLSAVGVAACTSLALEDPKGLAR